MKMNNFFYLKIVRIFEKYESQRAFKKINKKLNFIYFLN